MTHIHHLFSSTCFAAVPNGVALDFVVGFRVATNGAEYKFFHVTVHQFLQHTVGMGPIDNGAVRVGIVARLRTELGTKVLAHLARSAVQRQGHIANVGQGRLDAVTGTFNFSKDCGHFVAILGIVDRSRARNVDDLSAAVHHG